MDDENEVGDLSDLRSYRPLIALAIVPALIAAVALRLPGGRIVSQAQARRAMLQISALGPGIFALRMAWTAR